MTWGWKVPSPLPSSTDTVPLDSLSDGQVGPAVTREVPRHYGCWHRPDGGHGFGLWLEGAVAIAQEHRHAVASFVDDGEIGPAVASEVARHDAHGYDPAA